MIRRSILYEGPEILFHSHLDLFLLENMDTEPIVSAMLQADPEVVEMVRRRFPGEWEGFGEYS